ncbi:pectin lyase F-2 [Fusarium albosuccineum]|uniref:pectin lyase n=1 Tax=Fusarium albosuccineum TaxID=1237068 RepID=A0A8H4LJX6_9HYPO|nr:pectin lyase F-2 [Fusarium albosuccineum]
MRMQALSVLLAAAATASAQAVVGTPYGFASGVTGGSGEAVTPSTAEELAELLADDEPRVIFLDKEFDFTGNTQTGAGCDRKSCSNDNGGQLYLGDLSCGGDDNVAVSSVSYDAAGPEPLPVGSNKSILGNGKAVLKGKGLSVQKGASNVIIQGIEFTNINPGVVWGGDALELKGLNDGVWIDHCKFSLVGRMFIVSHYDGSRFTISNNEFDGTTEHSASCNGNHYWTMMFYGEGDKVTLDRNYFHDVSGRAPKLGEDGTNGYFQASNNYFSNMKGHAFDAYNGANAIIEGNVFEGVDTPITDKGASVKTIFDVPDESAAAACESALGRACEVNSVTSSGELPALSDTSGVSALAEFADNIITPVAASEVAALVRGSAGPANVGSGSSSGGSDTPAASAGTETEAPAATSAPATENTEAPAATTKAPAADVTEAPVAENTEAPVSDDVEVPETESADTEAEESEAETPAASDSGSSAQEAQQWQQCGGANWTGATKCASGFTCQAYNEYYSQCVGSASRRMRRAARLN